MKILKKILILFEFTDSRDYNDEIGNQTLKNIHRLLPLHYNEFRNEIYGKSKEEKIDILKHYISLVHLKNEWIEFYKTSVTTKEKRVFTFSELEFFDIYESLIENLGIICLTYSIFIDEILSQMELQNNKINLYHYSKEKLKFIKSNKDSLNERDEKLLPFTDKQSNELFMFFYKKFAGQKYYLAEISYVYRIMYKEDLIINIYRPEIFRQWMVDNKLEELKHSIKTYNEPQKNKKYLSYELAKNKIFNK